MNKRLAEILLILLKQNDYITINTIAKRLDVSNRTIRNDLDSLDSLLPNMNLKLIKKTGVGVFLEGDINSKLKVYDSFKQSKREPSIDTPQARHDYILLKLTTVSYYRIFEFVEELYVSRATIHKDLQIIEDYLLKFNLNLERSNKMGVSIKGSERNIRNMMFDVCFNSHSNQIINIFNLKDDACVGDFVFQGLDLTDDEVNFFIKQTQIDSVESLKSLSLESLTQIIVRLIVNTSRCMRNNFVPISDDLSKTLSKRAYQEDAKFLVQNIFNSYNIPANENEISYFQVYLLAYQEEQSSTHIIETERFVEDLVTKWSEVLSIDLNSDVVLISNLVQHLLPVYTRIEHDIPVENNLMHEIRKLYSNTYHIVQESIQSYPYWKNMSKEDIGFVSLHLAAAIERTKIPLNALLVYGNGLGAKLLIRDKITNSIAQINIIDDVNFSLFANYQYNDIYDLIITTVDLNCNTSTPIIKINSLLNQTDLDMLNSFVSTYYKNKNNPGKRD